jgi:hypothetical protein
MGLSLSNTTTKKTNQPTNQKKNKTQTKKSKQYSGFSLDHLKKNPRV